MDYYEGQFNDDNFDFDLVGLKENSNQQEDQTNQKLSEPIIFKTLANKINFPCNKSCELRTFQEDLHNSTTRGHQNSSSYSDYSPEDMFYTDV